MIDHHKATGNYCDSWTGNKRNGNSQKNGIYRADVAAMSKSHNEDKVKAEDEKSVLDNELMAMLADITAKQIINIQAGVSSLGPKRVKLVAIQAQAASAEAHNTNGESIAGSLMEKLIELGKNKSD